MEIATLPVTITPQPSAAGSSSDTDAAISALTGQWLPQDIFAALLAQQLEAAPDVKPAARVVANSAEASDLSAKDDNPLLAGLDLSALVPGTPVPVPPMNVQPASNATTDDEGTRVIDMSAGRRQPVAAASAAFAESAAAKKEVSVGAAVDAKGASAHAASFSDLMPAPQTAAHMATSLSTQPVVNAVAHPAGPTPATITPPVSTGPAWAGALGDHVVWMVGKQQQGAELHLNPPSLGPLEIKLSMSDGQANLTFSTQHLPVREAIEAATPRLREMFGDSGISLGSVSVNVGSFTQQQPGDQAQTGRNAQPWTPATSETDFSSILPSAVTVLGRDDGMVDIFA